ncbi:TetR/AcrR family transcriptional regulator [Methylomagnum sp.]
MARNREFCPTEALDKAMRVFWAKGYGGTSIEDLVSATGVSRYGLYGEFGGKNGLFLASLEHYRANIIRPLLDIIERPDAALAEIRALFDMLVALLSQPGGELGCLIFNAVHEMGSHDEATGAQIMGLRENLAAGLRRMLHNAAHQGELPAGFDVEREADFLFGVMHALPMLARAGTDPKVIEHTVSVALSTLGPAVRDKPEHTF